MEIITAVTVTGFAFILIFFAGIALGEAATVNKSELSAKADEGLFYCKLGENYVWLDKGDVLTFFFTDRSE